MNPDTMRNRDLMEILAHLVENEYTERRDRRLSADLIARYRNGMKLSYAQRKLVLTIINRASHG